MNMHFTAGASDHFECSFIHIGFPKDVLPKET